MVGLDVAGNLWGEQVGAGIAEAETLAQVGGGDVFVDILKDVDAGSLGWGEGQARGVGLQAGIGVAGSGDHNPVGKFQEGFGVVPLGERGEAVGADEVEELCAGHGVAQTTESVGGEVGGAVGPRGIEGGGGKAGVGHAGEGGEGEALVEGGAG